LADLSPQYPARAPVPRTSRSTKESSKQICIFGHGLSLVAGEGTLWTEMVLQEYPLQFQILAMTGAARWPSAHLNPF